MQEVFCSQLLHRSFAQSSWLFHNRTRNTTRALDSATDPAQRALSFFGLRQRFVAKPRDRECNQCMHQQIGRLRWRALVIWTRASPFPTASAWSRAETVIKLIHAMTFLTRTGDDHLPHPSRRVRSTAGLFEDSMTQARDP
jgi:hypothetical protein